MNRNPTPARRLRAIAAVLALVTTASCANRGSPIQIGSKRVAVDLQFKDDTKADAPKPPIVLELPAINPSNTLALDLPKQVPPRVVPAPVDPCPAAPAGTPARELAPTKITQPPRMGVYPARVEGKFDITVGASQLTFQGRAPATVAYGNLQKTGTGDATIYSYDVIVKLGTTSTTTTSFVLRPASGDVQLVRQVTVSPTGTDSFQPAQPMTWYVMSGVGTGPENTDQWSSAGLDPTTSHMLTLQGSNVARDHVDVCGAVHDSFRSQQREHGLSASPMAPGLFTYDTTEPSGYVPTGVPATPPGGDAKGSPNIYDIAPQFGGLVLRTGYHYTKSETTAGAGGTMVSATMAVDATLTLLSTVPTAGVRS